MQIALSLFAVLVVLDSHIGTKLLRLPLVTGIVTGVLMKNVSYGVMIGASLQVLYYAYGLDGSNLSLYAMLVSAIAIKEQMDPSSIMSSNVNVAIGIAFASLCSLTGSLFLIPARKAIETQDVKKLGILNVVSLFVKALLGFVFVYVAYGYKDSLLNSLTGLYSSYKWVFSGLIMAGFLLRFLGIAVVLRNLLVKEYSGALLAGASLGILALGVNTYMMIPAVLLGIALAVYSYRNSRDSSENKAEARQSSGKKEAEKWW